MWNTHASRFSHLTLTRDVECAPPCSAWKCIKEWHIGCRMTNFTSWYTQSWAKRPAGGCD
eukprot:3703795-Pyramimonas_sp.AAC.2